MSEQDGREMLEYLKHAVGHPKFYRNHYCCGARGAVYERWMTMVAMGLAKQGTYINDERDMYFSVTSAGLEFLKAVKP